MKETFDSVEEANEVCVKLWDKLEAEFGDEEYSHYMPTVKREGLLNLGYKGLAANCPLCEFHHGNCSYCSLNDCCKHGYYSRMNGREIKRFNAFVKERLGV